MTKVISLLLWLLIIAVVGGVVFGIYWIVDTPNRKRKQKEEAESEKQEERALQNWLAQKEAAQVEYDRKHTQNQNRK